MSRWILKTREYSYNVHYVEGKDNYVADHVSRSVIIVVSPPEASLFGLAQTQFKERQREEPIWRELVEFLEGSKIPTKRLPKPTLHQFARIDNIFVFCKRKVRRQSPV